MSRHREKPIRRGRKSNNNTKIALVSLLILIAAALAVLVYIGQQAGTYNQQPGQQGQDIYPGRSTPAPPGLVPLVNVSTPLNIITLHQFYAYPSEYAFAPNNINFSVHQYDYNSNHTYYLNESLPYANITDGGADIGTPTIAGDIILVPTMGNVTYLVDSRYDLSRGTLSAFDISTGMLLWKDTFADQVMTQPITAGGNAIITVGNNQEVPLKYKNEINSVLAVNIINGSLEWNFTPEGPIIATPAYYNGTIVDMGLGTVYQLNATTGRLINFTWTGLPDLLSSPMLHDGIAYYGSGWSTAINGVIPPNGTRHFNFSAFDMQSHTFVWRTNFPMAGSGLNDICSVFYRGNVIAGYLYNSTYNNPVIVSMNATTGRVLWYVNETNNYYTANPNNVIQPSVVGGNGWNYTQNSMSPLVLWHGNVFSDSNFIGYLFSINATTGAINWVFNTNQNEGAPNIFAGHYLVTVTDGGTLFVLNATDGHEVKQFNIQGGRHLSDQPIVTNNYVIIGMMNGTVMYFPINWLLNATANSLPTQ